MAQSLRTRRWSVIVVVVYAVGVDYLFAGVIHPLTPFSPANITKDEELTILAGCYAGGAFLTTPIVGYLGDRFGCRRPMIAGALLLAAATALFAFANNFGLMIGAHVLQGVAAAATWTAGLALVAENYSGNRVQMMGYAMMGSSGGYVVGPLLAGGLYAIGGFRLSLDVVLAIIAVEIVACIALLPADRRSEAPQAGVVRLLLDRSILMPAFEAVLGSSAWTIVETLLPNLAIRGGASPAGIGILLTVSTVAYAMSAPLVTRIVDRFGMRRAINAGAVSMAVTIPLVSLFTNNLWLGFALCLISVAYALFLNPQSAEVGDAVERHGLRCYCAVYAVYNISFWFGTIIIAAAASVLLPHFSSTIVLLCVSGVMLLSVPVMLIVQPPAEPLPAGPSGVHS